MPSKRFKRKPLLPGLQALFHQCPRQSCSFSGKQYFRAIQKYNRTHLQQSNEKFLFIGIGEVKGAPQKGGFSFMSAVLPSRNRSGRRGYFRVLHFFHNLTPLRKTKQQGEEGIFPSSPFRGLSRSGQDRSWPTPRQFPWVGTHYGVGDAR